MRAIDGRTSGDDIAHAGPHAAEIAPREFRFSAAARAVRA
jgi:hypothetical protein